MHALHGAPARSLRENPKEPNDAQVHHLLATATPEQTFDVFILSQTALSLLLKDNTHSDDKQALLIGEC